MSNKRKIGSSPGAEGRKESAEIPAIFLTGEDENAKETGVKIDIDQPSTLGSDLSADSGAKPTASFLAMNMDPGMVRRKSQQFEANMKAEEEKHIQEAVQRERKEMAKLVSQVSVAKDSSAFLHPDKNQFRRGVTGSMSIPMNKMSLKIYGSEKAVKEEQSRLEKAGNLIIHPYSNFRFIWDSFTLVLLLINIILIPVAISFWKDNQVGWLTFKGISDVWFLLDIVFNFRTGIVIDGPDSEVILDPKQIRKMYLKTWFVVDFISTFPFDLPFTIVKQSGPDMTANGAISGSGMKALSLLRMAKILALLRLLRLSRFIRYMKQWEEIFNFQYELALAFARILNLIMLMLFICHFNGCLQWMVPMFLEFPDGTWAKERNLHLDHVTVWERYSWSVFKSTSHMLCIGYGQQPPHSIVDLWVTYVSMCSGAMCFALFIGNATSLIQSMDASKRSYKEKYMQVKEYMQFRKLPAKLRHKISDYYENRYQGKMFDEKRILAELNHNLREEVINYNCKELVDQVPFFSEADESFVSSVLQKLSFEVFLSGEIIVREGSTGDKMYFINRGTVTIKSAQHNIEQSLSDGCYFGEIALLQQNLRRIASVSADTYCYLYSLSVGDFNEVLKEFPKQRSKLSIVAQSRIKDNNAQDTFTSTCSIVPLDGPQKLPPSPLTEIVEESSEMLEEYHSTKPGTSGKKTPQKN